MEKKLKNMHTCCYIVECTRVVYKTCSKASFSAIFAEPISDEGIALCLEHDGELYHTSYTGKSPYVYGIGRT